MGASTAVHAYFDFKGAGSFLIWYANDCWASFFIQPGVSSCVPTTDVRIPYCRSQGYALPLWLPRSSRALVGRPNVPPTSFTTQDNNYRRFNVPIPFSTFATRSKSKTFDPNTGAPDLHGKVCVVTRGRAGGGFGIFAHLIQHSRESVYLLSKKDEANEAFKQYRRRPAHRALEARPRGRQRPTTPRNTSPSTSPISKPSLIAKACARVHLAMS